MMVSSTLLVTLTMLLGQQALAAPAPQLLNPFTQACMKAERDEFQNVVTERYTANAEAVTGASCISSRSEACSLDKGYQWSKGTSFSIGGTIGPKAKLTPLWEAQGGISLQYSWITTKGESTSTRIGCPKVTDGELACGMIARPEMVKLVGQTRHMDTCGDFTKWEDFEAHVPATKTTRNEQANGKDGAENIMVKYEGCIHDCTTEKACAEAQNEGLDLCPGSEKPEHLDENPCAGLALVGVMSAEVMQLAGC